MTRSTGDLDFPANAVVIFEYPTLRYLADVIQALGFRVMPFEDAGQAMQYIGEDSTYVSVIIANGVMLGVMNDTDIATALFQSYPTLPIILLDHYDGLVANNVMCIDKPWTLEDVGTQALVMVARLPVGKKPSKLE